MPSFLKGLAQHGALDLPKKKKKGKDTLETSIHNLFQVYSVPGTKEDHWRKLKPKIIMGTISRNHTSTQLNFAKILVFFSSLSFFKTEAYAYRILCKMGTRLSASFKVHKILCILVDTYMSWQFQ